MALFDHEKLDVYKASIVFVAWLGELLDGPLSECRLSAVKSVGSALECAACLDLLKAKRLLKEEAIRLGKEQLLEIVSMLMGLINSLNARLQEDTGSYSASEQEQE